MSEPSETETVDYWRERVAKIGSPVDALFVLGREYSDPESSLLTSEAILAVVEEILSSLEAFAGSTTDGVCYEPERDGPAPEEERKYPCDRCGKLRSKAEGGTVFTVCDECWDATYRRTAPAREAVGEDAVDKLARIHDWLKYEANSEGGMGQEIRDTLRRLRASAPGR